MGLSHLNKSGRFLFLLLCLLCLLFVGYFIWTYMLPFVIAFILAGVLQRFIRLLQKWLKVSRGMAAFIMLTFFIFFFTSIAALLLAELIRSIQYFAGGLPIHFKQLIELTFLKATSLLTPLIEKGNQWAGGSSSITENLEILKGKTGEFGADFLSFIFQFLIDLIAGIPVSLASIVIIVLSTFFLSKDWELIKQAVVRMIPYSLSAFSKQFPKDLKKSIKGMMKAQIILVTTSMAIIWTGLMLLQSDHTITLTVLAGLVDLIPFIGTGVIFLPWMIYQFILGNIKMAIGLLMIYVIVLITRQALEPKLLASHFGVPPIFFLIVLFVSFQLFGVYGIIFSPFIVITFKTLHTSGLLQLSIDFITGTKK